MKVNILKWLGLKWVKVVLGILVILGTLFLLYKGFEAVVIEPIVEKRMEPVVVALDSARADIADYARTDSVQKRQIGELQLTLRDQGKRNREKVDSLKSEFSAFNAKRTAEFQGVIKLQSEVLDSARTVLGSLRQAQGATMDSLRRAESGLRVDLVTLKFGWLGKLKDSSYTKGYQWPLFDNP